MKIDVQSEGVVLSAVLSPERLGEFFRPRSVALVGAANKSMFSAIAFRNLVQFGMGASVYLVNQRGAETHGRPTAVSCADIGEPVDIALLMVPQAGTLDAMSDAASAGIRNVVILSSGYGDAGPRGRLLQDEMVAHAEALDIVVLGPNHLGFVNFVDRVPVAAIPDLPQRFGPVALLSQSGASSSSMLDFAGMSGVELSYAVTLGNEAMVTAGDIIDFLVDDDATKAVAIFMETVRSPNVFVRAARRAAEAGKAVVVLKAGTSELSARTAVAHTGALVGDDRVIDVMFRELGVIRVDSIEDMLITAGLAAATGRLSSRGIAVASISGGACDIFADRAEELGVPLPELAPATVAALTEVMPTYGTVQNPLDITGAAIINPALFTQTITALANDPSIGVVAAISVLPWKPADGPYLAQSLVDAIGAAGKDSPIPVVLVNQVMQPISEVTERATSMAGVEIVICGLRQAVLALGKVAQWSATRPNTTARSNSASVAIPAIDQRRGEWSEAMARGMLQAADIPVVPSHLVASADEAVRAAREFGYPVVLKLVSPQVMHKSEIGGVKLHLQGDEAVRTAHAEVRDAAKGIPEAVVEGVLVSPMRGGGVELLVGVVKDPEWGAILAIAIGGVFVEVLNDSILASAPVTASYARDMLDRLKGAALLHGARGTEPADLDAVASVIARVSELAVSLGDELESLEINPLRVAGAQVEALDAVITWKRAATAST